MPAHHAFWPKRLPHQMSAPQTSLWMNLHISAMRYPLKEALVFMGQTWSYARLHNEAEKIASALRKMGVQKGDRVVLDMQNCPQLVITHFAILRLDAVVVPVNPMNRMEELKHYILDPYQGGRDHGRPGTRIGCRQQCLRKRPAAAACVGDAIHGCI
jgi:fatty-acyl-CoA synthase